LDSILDKLEFLVVQYLYPTTETAQRAHLFLPAAGWGEKDGTFINSERRFGTTRKVARAPGRALSDFSIFKLIAEAWGCGDLFRRWSSPEAVFGILKELSAGRPCDISGIDSYEHLDAAGGIQWPCPGETTDGNSQENERRLFSDGRFFTDDERARILFDPPREPPERPDEDYPFWLNTGRGSSAQWHTGSRTNKSDVLRKLGPRSVYFEMHPEDAVALKIKDGEIATIASRRGRIEAAAFVTPTVPPGQIFLPMHFPEVNRLTFPAFDPHSRQPSYKACAVRLEKQE
jgi:assimilatory nitrate reductase catalytic subunit